MKLGLGLVGSSVVKKMPASAGDVSLLPGSRRCPGGRNGNPLQYSCLGNPMDRGPWQATVHGVTKSLTQLCANTHTHTHVLGTVLFYLHCLN